MPIDRANVASVQRAAQLERAVAQQGTDIKRLLRRIGELVDTHQPAMIPGDRSSSETTRPIKLATLNEALPAGGSALATLREWTGSGWVPGTTVVRVYDHILDTSSSVDSGTVVPVGSTEAEGAWVLLNAKCTSIS